MNVSTFRGSTLLQLLAAMDDAARVSLDLLDQPPSGTDPGPAATACLVLDLAP